ncbi:MAG: hypothetical protein EHM46_04005 [Bacteroidetes bacterium]|nr:MAG: hypothetical protein EHM46_04005 [Bacteroidota bacterium]
MHAQESSGHHDHHHRHSEISIGTGAVFMPGESWGYGLHLHGTLGITEWMGAGAGFELIAGEHTHYTITGLLHFHPFHPLDINIGPGLVLPDEELPQYRLKTHAEIAAVFEVSEHLHLGPALDLGVGKHDLHLTPGIHIGWIFNIGEEFRGPGDLH